MRLILDVKTLNAGIATVIKSLSSRPALPVLEGIYLCASQEGLLLRCSDLSLQIECTVPATVEEEGATVLPGRLFAEMARKFPGETVDLKLDGHTMTMKAGRAVTKLQCMEPREYPDMAVVGKTTSLSMPQKALKDMIRQTVFATAQEESKPILTGVLCELEQNIFTMVALDGFRLALRRYGVNVNADRKEAVVPAKSFLEISRTLLDVEDAVEVQFSPTHLLINMGHTRIVSRLLDGDFIKYRSILPSEHLTRVRINRDELLESIDRAMLMAREGSNNLVRFSVSEDLLKLTANSALGRIDEEIAMHLNGDPIEIAFNARYFADVLKTLDDDEIFLDMNNNVSPCVVRPTQGEAYYYLILPVRIFA